MIKVNVATKNTKTQLTIVETDSGMWIAYYDNFSNVISNGFTLDEALENLKTMMATILNDGYKFCFSHTEYTKN